MADSDCPQALADKIEAMKYLLSAALAAILCLPLAAYAQQSNQTNAAPQSGAPAARVNGRLYKRWSQFLSGVNLTDQQHTQIQSYLDQFAQAHPVGSPPDRQAAHALRDQIFSLLTPDQQNQVRQEIRNLQAQRRQRRLQQQQQQNSAQSSPQPAATP
jgi:hypothetical protein